MTKARQDKEKGSGKGIPKARKPFDIDAAARMYRAGTHKIRGLAEWSGYCYGTVRRRLMEGGVELDRPGGNRRKRKDAQPPVAPEPTGTDDAGTSPPQEGDAG